MLLFALLVVGCSTRMGDLTIVSNRNVSLEAAGVDSLPLERRVEGRSTRFIFLFIPFGSPSLEEAIDDALDRGQGNLLTNVTIHSTSWWFLVGQTGIRVRGDVTDTRLRRTR
jgi:hypothetical protein